MRKLRGLAQTLLVTLFLSVSANAGTTDPVKMDRSIDTVLSRSEYAWRSPRIKSESDRKGSKAITRFYDAVGAEIKALAKQVFKAAKAVANWVAKFWKPKTIEKSESSTGGGAAALPAILYGLIGLMLLATAMILWRRWKQDRQRSTPLTALAMTAEPDLWAEEISADQLPEERWLELAREMIAKGELRLGLRAMYLAGLAHLGNKEFVRLERAKSNRDFLNELRRKARPHPELIDAFHENVKAFERVWYGAHPVNSEIVDLYTDNLNRIRQF